MTLAEFLLARITEDEALALTAGAGHPTWTGYVMEDIAGRTVYDDQWSVATVTAYDHNKPLSNKPGATGPAYRDAAGDATSQHIARWDPARVLAECEAKRQMVALAQHIADGAWQDGELRAVSEFRSTKLLQLLALPYADHPDYDNTWAPA